MFMEITTEGYVAIIAAIGALIGGIGVVAVNVIRALKEPVSPKPPTTRRRS